MSMTLFEEVLPQLTSAYDRGLLVPFLGSGMSIGTCPNWQDLVESLEKHSGIVGNPSGGSPEDLVRRANVAVRTLRNRKTDQLARTLRTVLGSAGAAPPKQTAALAERYWPLTLTTNYDDCYATAYRNAQTNIREPLEIMGRSSADCHRILTSLSSPSGPLLWALQGYLASPCQRPRGQLHPLSGEVVVGHEEYSKVTHRDTHFRRAFAEVYRQRSLMFVGSGLADPYLQGLFTEIQELYGTGARRHYALIHAQENVDRHFMRARFNILVIPYEKHSDLPLMLARLDKACEERSTVSTTAYTIASNENRQANDDHQPDLMIVRAKLPTHLLKSECAAISVGGGGTSWYVSNVISETFINQTGIRNLIGDAKPSNKGYQAPHRWYVRRYGDAPIFQVRPRSANLANPERSRAWGDRDVRFIRTATRALLDIVAETPYKTLRMQMLSAGGKRTFPKRVSLIQTVRAFGAWKRETGSDLRLAIHVVAPEVWLDITSGKINVVDLATVEQIRFWVELLPVHGTPERRIFDLPGHAPLDQLLALLAVPHEGWTAEAIPAPEVGAGSFDIAKSLHASLDDLGIIPASTLRLKQVS